MNEEITKEKLQAYKEHLTVITKGLKKMAMAAGRKDTRNANKMLRACYGFTDDKELLTEEQWNARGYSLRRGEYAYLFWKSNKVGGEIDFLFEEAQFFKDALRNLETKVTEIQQRFD